MEDQLIEAGIVSHEIPVGADRLIVVYVPPDTGGEIDPNALFGLVGADAASRESEGWLLASIDTMNLRHAGMYLALQGSGVETKLAVVALFARS